MSELLSPRLSQKAHSNILRQVINSMTDSVFFKGLDGRYMGCNHEYEKLMGKPESAIIGKTARDLNEPELATRYEESDRTIIDTGLPIRMEVWLKKPDGTMALIENVKAPLFDDDGKISGIIGVMRDITRERQVEAALSASEEKYRMIAENTSDVIWVYNLDQDRMTFCSPSVTQLRGLTVEEAMAERPVDTVTPEFRDVLAERLFAARTFINDNPGVSTTEVVEVQQLTKEGGTIWVEISARLGFNKHEEAEVLGISRNIEARKRVESEILYLGYHDQLTGTFNRHYFDTVIAEEMERSDRYGEPLSLVLLDLDHFKVINDTWGHPTGDDFLKSVARVVERTIRSSDVLARFGGEEFVVLMKQTDREQAAEAAERIRVAVENEHHPLAGTRTVSVGVAQRLLGESFRHWYRRADEALYIAKELGRNRVVASEKDEVSRSSIVRMSWRAEWESGNAEIDTQHQELIDTANRLLNASLAGRDSFETDRQVELLLSRTAHHFESEEDVLSRLEFPGLPDHAKTHTRLLTRATRLNELYKSGKVKASALFSFIVDDVVLGHMIESDTKFFAYTARRN